jgi:hypothetical protein
MVGVRRLSRDADADKSDDVGSAIGQGMEAVRQYRHGAGAQSKSDLGNGDGEVEKEDSDEDPRDGRVAVHG